jgi:hypothetical protein
MRKSRRRIIKYIFAYALIALGLALNYSNLEMQGFTVYESFGSYLAYLGFMGLIAATMAEMWRKDKIVDERMQFVATRALRSTFLSVIVAAFAIIVVDGIYPITIPYHLFMSYLVAGMLAAYYISYHILLRRY